MCNNKIQDSDLNFQEIKHNFIYSQSSNVISKRNHIFQQLVVFGEPLLITG